MTYFIQILLYNVIPLTVMISIGFTLHRVFRLDIKTLSKLIFYVFGPAVVFLKLYESNISWAVVSDILLFFFIYFGALVLLAESVIRMRRYTPSKRSAMRNSVIFYNSANYAIPLNQLVFANNPLAMSIQIIIMTFQNVIPNTYGIYSVNAHKQKWKQTARVIFSLPVIYAIPIAILLRELHAPIPEPVYIPIQYIADGFIAVALITLGVQLASMDLKFSMRDVAISNVLRLIAGPAIGFATAYLLGLEGLVAHALILSCAVPTSLSSVLLAIEFDNEPEFASQCVLTSTTFSMITVTIVIFLLSFYP